MTIKHPEKHPEKDVKHPEKHPGPEKHLDKESPTQRVQIHNATIGDETSIGHGTKSYTVPRDGIVDLPKEAAEHVIRQGGAVPLDPLPTPSDVKVTVKHVSDPKATLAYGDEQKSGEFEVPVSILPEIAPHGFVPVEKPDDRRSK